MATDQTPPTGSIVILQPSATDPVACVRAFLGRMEYGRGIVVRVNAARFFREILGVPFDGDGRQGLNAFAAMRAAYRALPWDDARESMDRHAVTDSMGRPWVVEAVRRRRRWCVDCRPYADRNLTPLDEPE